MVEATTYGKEKTIYIGWRKKLSSRGTPRLRMPVKILTHTAKKNVKENTEKYYRKYCKGYYKDFSRNTTNDIVKTLIVILISILKITLT